MHKMHFFHVVKHYSHKNENSDRVQRQLVILPVAVMSSVNNYSQNSKEQLFEKFISLKMILHFGHTHS